MIDVYPHQLSGGQRQRIMIAAAVLDPVLLIATSRPPRSCHTQAQILKLIKSLRDGNTACCHHA